MLMDKKMILKTQIFAKSISLQQNSSCIYKSNTFLLKANINVCMSQILPQKNKR